MISMICRPYVKHLLRCRNVMECPGLKRNSSYEYWVYRGPCKPPPKWDPICADILGGFVWWWILIHVWYQFDHLVGEFPYPKRKKWADEELGVPPLDY